MRFYNKKVEVKNLKIYYPKREEQIWNETEFPSCREIKGAVKTLLIILTTRTLGYFSQNKQ